MVALIAIAAVVAAGGANAARSSSSASSLVGKWKGHLGASGKRTLSFQVSINSNQRSGTWRISSSCSGTLRLDDISDGYHHYYREYGKDRGCGPPGVDCLRRTGAGVVDWFSNPQGIVSYDGTLRRA